MVSDLVLAAADEKGGSKYVQTSGYCHPQGGRSPTQVHPVGEGLPGGDHNAEPLRQPGGGHHAEPLCRTGGDLGGEEGDGAEDLGRDPGRRRHNLARGVAFNVSYRVWWSAKAASEQRPYYHYECCCVVLQLCNDMNKYICIGTGITCVC